MATKPIDVVIWVSGGNVQGVTSSDSERMVRVFIADEDNAEGFEDECLEQAIVCLPIDVGFETTRPYALGEQLVVQEDTTYIHEAMERIRVAVALEDEYGPANPQR